MSRLLKNEEGNILALFAAAVIPVFGLVGGGVDMSRIYLSQTRLQGACDAGALIGRKTMGLGKWADNSNAANTQAEKLFDQNFPSGVYGTTNRVRSFAESKGIVTGTASVTIPMTLMRVLGQESQTVNVNCQAELRVPNTDVMFVLDTTGSMDRSIPDSDSSESKINGLRTAVKCFYEALAKKDIGDIEPSHCGETSDPVASNIGNVTIRFGFVPYAVNVNVGKLLPLDYMADRWTYQSREASFTIGNTWVPKYLEEIETNSGVEVDKDETVTEWTNTPIFQNVMVENIEYSYVFSTTELDRCTTRSAPPETTTTNVGSRQMISQLPATPVYPVLTVTRNYEQVNSTVRKSYRYNYVSDIFGTRCRLQSRVTTKANVTTTTATVDIDWTRNGDFTGWTYKPVSFNVSGLKDKGTNSWRSSFQLPIGDKGTDTPVNWDGCIEERQTYRGPDGDPSNDWDPIPKDALDMDIDLVPTKSNTASQWGPMLPSIIWQRFTVDNSGNRTDTPTTSNIWVAQNSKVEMETISNNCPTAARTFQTWDPSEFSEYVTKLTTGGNTYHDIGLLWGARIMSPTGIFAALNAPKNMTIERHMVFMTDGETYTEETNYSAYGVHWYDRRQTPTGTAPTRSQLNNLTNARTVALCKAIKNKNINLWVVSYGDVDSATNDRLKACATPGKFVQATSVPSLIRNFKEIAAKISALRLTQ